MHHENNFFLIILALMVTGAFATAQNDLVLKQS